MGRVQKFIDSEIIRRCDPYVPLRTRTLKNSVISHTVVGSGKIVYKTPYAKKQYYNGRQPGTSKFGALRGQKWFERMKNSHAALIISQAEQIVGGRAK
jgi:hypothetical protein